LVSRDSATALELRRRRLTSNDRHHSFHLGERRWVDAVDIVTEEN
jgi:hypothetical protein